MRIVKIAFLYLIVILLLFNCSETPEKNLKPNIILIVADDHGTDDMGCYGNTAIKTPNLDKLAFEGVRFTKAYCTTASCSASRSRSARLSRGSPGRASSPLRNSVSARPHSSSARSNSARAPAPAPSSESPRASAWRSWARVRYAAPRLER